VDEPGRVRGEHVERGAPHCLRGLRPGLRAGLHAGKSPVLALLFARQIAPSTELSKAWGAQARRRGAPGALEDLSVIVVDVADWSCRLPPDCSAAAHKLADQICVP
jgi:hypothetical protein